VSLSGSLRVQDYCRQGRAGQSLIAWSWEGMMGRGAEKGRLHQCGRGHSFTSWVRHVKPPDRKGQLMP